MFRNQAVIHQVLQVFLGEVICVGLMLGIYAIAGYLTKSVLWGAAFGCLMAFLNFFFLSVAVSRAADRAETTGQSAKAQVFVQVSSLLRLLAIAVLYIVVLRNGSCDPVAAILPLVFVQISILMLEFFRKDKDGAKQK